MGPVRHCGVLSVAQCRHFRPSPPLSTPSFFFEYAATFTVFFATAMSGSRSKYDGVNEGGGGGDDEGDCWERTRRRDVQLHGAARDRLLRALAGTDISGRNIGLLLLFRIDGSCCGVVSDVSSTVRAFMPDIICSFCKSSLENDSSTKFDSHSSSAKSSYCNNHNNNIN